MTPDDIITLGKAAGIVLHLFVTYLLPLLASASA